MQIYERGYMHRCAESSALCSPRHQVYRLTRSALQQLRRALDCSRKAAAALETVQREAARRCLRHWKVRWPIRLLGPKVVLQPATRAARWMLGTLSYRVLESHVAICVSACWPRRPAQAGKVCCSDDAQVNALHMPRQVYVRPLSPMDYLPSLTLVCYLADGQALGQARQAHEFWRAERLVLAAVSRALRILTAWQLVACLHAEHARLAYAW